jgi:hypothetical protein
MEPSHFVQTFENVPAQCAQVIGDDDDRKAFDGVLQNGLAFGRLIHARQQSQILSFD